MGKKGLAALVLLVALSIGTAAVAQPVDAFYRGKQIRVICGAAAGQDYDIWIRLIARHMGRHIPGNPILVVENMPGAGHLIATNYLYNVAAKDGTVLGMVTRNITDDAVLKIANVRFDPLRFNWLGSPEINHRAFWINADSPIRSGKDLFEHEVLTGATGPGQAVTTAPVLLKNVLGMKLKIIQGYNAPLDIALAMARGEVSAFVDALNGPNSARKREWLDSGRMRVLFTLEPDASWLGAPSLFQYLTSEEQRQIFTFLSGSMELGRPLMAPPGVPPERVALLRRAFDETMADRAFRADAEGAGFEITPLTGVQVEALVKATMATPREVAEKAERAAAN
jgi:tripartite-type tricarboxylate transporter receptor subunit TctC